MSLKHKTISALFWSFVEDLARTGLIFVCGIVLARLLTPREFGLIGMTTIFIAVSQTFIDSGFSQTLIRKQDCTLADYSTVFYFNVLISLLACLFLLAVSGPIGHFFDEPELPDVIRALSMGLVFNALSQVHRTQITKSLDFKLLTRISIISSAVSGIIGVVLAVVGYGVWSLVAMTLLRAALEMVLFWLWRDWRPSMTFDRAAFKEMFTFGAPLLASGLIGTFHKHLSSLVIGKFFSATDLGQFTQAQTFRNLPSERLTDVVHRVSYPVLATLQDDVLRLKSAYRKLIRSFMLVTSVMMLGLAAVAEPLIITLVGEQWRPAIGYLQLLCFVAMLYPLHAVNLNMLKVRGRSDLSLKLTIIKTSISLPAMGIGILWGIPAMIVAMFYVSCVCYLITASWSGKLIGYSLAEQFRDILPPFALAAALAVPVHLLGQWLPVADFQKLLVQVGVGAILAFVLAESTRLESYLYLKAIGMEKLAAIWQACRERANQREKGSDGS